MRNGNGWIREVSAEMEEGVLIKVEILQVDYTGFAIK